MLFMDKMQQGANSCMMKHLFNKLLPNAPEAERKGCFVFFLFAKLVFFAYIE